MEFRQLHAFCAVTNTSSFTHAAKMLGYAESSISTQIQLLEEELNTKLFERLGKMDRLSLKVLSHDSRLKQVK